MLPEISLNILDITQNSIRAGASLIAISVNTDPKAGTLELTISDNGSGMNEDQLSAAEDPFYTSRTTRKVGLGIPFFKQAALATGGSFNITSKPGLGTTVNALFNTAHIDCMPLGDITGTMLTLISGLDDHEGDLSDKSTDIIYTYSVGDREFSLDTRELREVLGGVPLNEPDVYMFLSEFLTENKKEADGQ